MFIQTREVGSYFSLKIGLRRTFKNLSLATSTMDSIFIWCDDSFGILRKLGRTGWHNYLKTSRENKLRTYPSPNRTLITTCWARGAVGVQLPWENGSGKITSTSCTRPRFPGSHAEMSIIIKASFQRNVAWTTKEKMPNHLGTYYFEKNCYSDS